MKVLKFFLTLFILFFPFLSFAQQDSYTLNRSEMVITQIEVRGITDSRILDAMRKVPRHKFVPANLAKFAYTDRPLPIGCEQTISQPFIVALMTEVLKLKSTDKVLEIGTGSGYQAAILAELADEVYTIEIIPELAQQAEETLITLGYTNVYVKTGDGFLGWPKKAPFDAIIVTCSPKEIPQPLKEQLAVGGRMVIPVGEPFFQKLVLLTKDEEGKITTEYITDVLFVPMTGIAEE